MIKTLRFVREFFRTPRAVGAIVPTSSFSAKAMLDASNLSLADVVVELGPGTGVITQEIIKRIRPDTLFICIEANKKFCRQIEHLFKNSKNRHLVCASANDLAEILERFGCESIDTVISALPYNSLPASLSKAVLSGVVNCMHDQSEFLAILYSTSCRPLFNEFFPKQNWWRTYRNIPPAYVAKMSL